MFHDNQFPGPSRKRRHAMLRPVWIPIMAAILGGSLVVAGLSGVDPHKLSAGSIALSVLAICYALFVLARSRARFDRISAKLDAIIADTSGGTAEALRTTSDQNDPAARLPLRKGSTMSRKRDETGIALARPAASRPDDRYTATARLFHWTVVALIVAQFAIAWTMPDIGRNTSPTGLVGWHLSIGATILVIALARLGWRMLHPAPPAPSDLPVILAHTSRLTHAGLYLLLIALPIMGWANANARGWDVSLFGAIPLPRLVPTGAAFGRSMGDVHATTAIILLVLIGLHVVGALYHALILRDRTLQRML